MIGAGLFEQGIPPTFDLGDLRLRPLKPGDEVALFEYRADPRVTEHTSIPEATVETLAESIRRDIAAYGEGTSCRFALAAQDDRLIGMCGFNQWSIPHRHAELAYELAPLHWRRGYMRRAIGTVLAWGFQRVALNRVHSFAMTSNQHSIGLLEKCGFTREGILREYRIARGTPRDFYIYSLLAGDFTAAAGRGSGQ